MSVLSIKNGIILGLSSLLFSSIVLADVPVGRLVGTVDVSQNGQANYSIDLKIPAGTAGVAPSLSLQYSSSPTRGLLGVGWSLGGISSITRCPKQKILDNNFNDAMSFNSEDKLCLDGQRLIGGNLDTATSYRTEILGFRKIDATLDSSLKQPKSIVVTTKDGSKMTYGASDDNYLVEVQGTTGNTRVILVWLLKTVEDINGNTISYHYSRELDTGSFVPLDITYTANTTVTPQLTASHKIVFEYVAGTDVPYSYINGGLSRNNKLLKNIKISTANTAGGFDEVRRYELGYRNDGAATPSPKPSLLTKRPLLSSITQCDKNTCLKPTTFSWLDNKLNFAKNYTGPAWSDADGWGNEKYYSTINMIDINGDGKTDICARLSTGIECYLSEGTGFSSTKITGPAWTDAASWDSEKYFSTIQFADINGDGKNDICARGVTGIECYLSTSTSTSTSFSLTKISGPAWSDTAGWGDATKKYYLNIRWTDLDQDGRADVCGIGPQGLACFYTKVSNTGSISFASALTETSWTSVDSNKIYPVLFMMDADHNQKTDVCARLLTVESGATKGKLSCLVQKTTGASLVYWESLSSTDDVNWQGTYLVDVNGDGFIDRCSVESSMVWCFKNKSINNDISKELTLEPIVKSTDLQDETIPIETRIKGLIDSLNIKNSVGFLKIGNSANFTGEENSYQGTVQFVDLNQDGLLDMCMRQPDGYRCRLQERQLASKMVRTIGEYVAKCLGETIAETDKNVCLLFGEMANASPDGFLDVFYTRIDIPTWSDTNSWSQEKYYRTIQLADINGDGYLELCGRESIGIRCYGTDNNLADKVSTITDGFGQQIIFNYKPLTDSAIYSKETATHPNIALQPAMQVVSSLKTSDGLGGFHQTDYKYGGLIANVDRGSQGFAWRESRNVQTQQLNYIHFKQVFPFTGSVDKTESRWCDSADTVSSSCTLLQRTLTTWNSINGVLSGSYQGILPYIESVSEEHWDKATTPPVTP